MENLTIKELKAFCINQGLIPTGDKRLKATWLEAAMSLKESAVKVQKAVTSPEAIEIYMTIVRFAVISCLGVMALGAGLRAWIDKVEQEATVQKSLTKVKSVAEFMMELWLSRRALLLFLFGIESNDYHRYVVDPLIMEEAKEDEGDKGRYYQS